MVFWNNLAALHPDVQSRTFYNRIYLRMFSLYSGWGNPAMQIRKKRNSDTPDDGLKKGRGPERPDPAR